jgi:hypothetical protein
MAHFRGYVVRGPAIGDRLREPASRVGTKRSGLEVVAQSWHGQIRVVLWHKDGTDWARIVVEPHGDPAAGKDLWCGPVKDLRAS